MPRIPLIQGLDVFAFLDADSAEAKAFTTYLGYWDGFARWITEEYGNSPNVALTQAVRERRQVKRLESSRFSGDPNTLSKILLNAWAQELGLYAVDDSDPRLMLQNLWNNVQAYYATSGLARAFLYTRNGEEPRTHAKTLTAASGLVTDTKLLPEPWCCSCNSSKAVLFSGFSTDPEDCHNLEASAPANDVLAKALKTTRKRTLDEKIDTFKKDRRLTRAPAGLRQQFERSVRPTTVFDFLWRNRTRSNYGDPSMFYMGSLSQSRSRSYVQAVQVVTSATMLVFEALVAQKAPRQLSDTAIHFISRDRSQISDLVLGSRLRALGILQEQDEGEDEPW